MQKAEEEEDATGAKSVPDGGRIGFRLPALSVVASDRERLVSRWFADLPIDGKGVLRISPILRKGRIRAFRREFFGAVVAAAARVVGSDAGVDGICRNSEAGAKSAPDGVGVLGVVVRASPGHVADGSFESFARAAQ